jgi:hypothetical protein
VALIRNANEATAAHAKAAKTGDKIQIIIRNSPPKQLTTIRHPTKKRPVTDAKEVEVGNPAEETFCHRTLMFIPQPANRRQPSLVICSPFFGHTLLAGRPRPILKQLNAGL